MEPKTPKKSSKAENGHLTPTSTAKKLYPGARSPNFSMENDCEKVQSPLVTNKATPRDEGTPSKSGGSNAGVRY